MRELLKPRFREYAELVLEKNRLLNLTAARSLDEIYDRHIEDGLAALPWLKRRFSEDAPAVADIGAGAGFIGIALKLAWPAIALTLVESRERRAGFLEWVTEKLKLRDVDVLRLRAETLAPHPALSRRRGEQIVTHKGRATMGRDFDVVVERALAPLPAALSACLPLVGPAGVFLAYQSAPPSPPRQAQDFAFPLPQPALSAVEGAGEGGRRPGEGARLIDTIRYSLPGEKRERCILCFERYVLGSGG